MKTTIEGELEKIVYTNEDNAFTVARLKIKGEQKPVTIVGTLISPKAGELLRVEGEWAKHKVYGRQFKINSALPMEPTTLKGIKKYLSSGMIKGIGPVTAERLVDKFGINTLTIMDKNLIRLNEVEGIGSKRIEMIKSAWDEQRGIRSIMIFLQGHGISAAYATKIYRQYKQKSIEVVKTNPYQLTSDIFGIGFKIADSIAFSLGIDPNSPLRAESAVLYVLNKIGSDGNVYYPYDFLIEKTAEMLQVDTEIVVKAIARKFQTRELVIEDVADDFDPSQVNRKAVYLWQSFLSETGNSNKLKYLLKEPVGSWSRGFEKGVHFTEKKLGIVLSDLQRKAVCSAATNKILVVTGGPGTGKTTIVKVLVEMVRRRGARILLAAPTGRAAKRLSEVTRMEASTIHRLLEFNFKKGGFQRDEQNPLNGDIIIIDEVSMIDNHLMYFLLKAVPLESTLILIGDSNQLPSVGPGNVLHDIINSKMIEVVWLEEIFRQAQESQIVINAHRINSGEQPLFSDKKKQTDNFFLFQEEDPEKILVLIRELFLEKIPKNFPQLSSNDIQVICPMHRGIIGTENLNSFLQQCLNPSGIEFKRGEKMFRLNDKVMQIKNNYDKDVFNGDIGKIVDINLEENFLTIGFDMRKVRYEFTELDELTLAYAISVHKSQGNEYPAIIMPVLVQHYIMLQRNLLYTGITRAKELVILAGTKRAIGIAIKNANINKRFTYLKRRLQDAVRSAYLEPM
ncbi:MAG: ATP-dependent RecD-like DNA helicase [Nitrospinota bacterium]|nr:ATP-dependent RecD-like DNA helicase [Nitrospinota bacterium]